MLIAKLDPQNRLSLTVSNSVAHYESSWCRQKRSARATTILTAAWMEEIPTYKSSAGKPQLPYSDLLECSVVVIAHFAPAGKPVFRNETNTLCVGVCKCVRMCAHACLSTKHFKTALALKTNKQRGSTLCNAPQHPKDHCLYVNLPPPCPLVLLLTVVFRGRWVWNINGLKVTGKNRSTGRKPRLNVALSTTNLTWSSSGSNRSLRHEWPAVNSLSHGTTFRLNLNYIIYKDSVCTARGHSLFQLDRSVSYLAVMAVIVGITRVRRY